jgi:hypothetical protein
VTDEELTDAWEAATVFPDGISHEQHLRIAWVLHRRYGGEEAGARLMSGTKRACAVHGCPEKYDAALTERWAHAIADAIERDGAEATARKFLDAHPQLLDGKLLGVRDQHHEQI